MTWEAEDVLSLVLVDPEARPLPVWEPGAHVDLHLPGGLVRQYSLCGDPRQSSSYRIAVLFERCGRGGSAFVHTQIRPGDTIGMNGPRNHFRLLPSSGYLFIAGGIGITPILPMVVAADWEGADWELLYGGRSRASMAFVDELADHGKRVTILPQDEQGLLPLDTWLSMPRPNTLVYCCGPEPLLTAVESLCSENWPLGSLQTERFAPRSAERSDECDDASDGDVPFEVECRASGTVVKVDAGCSVLQALRTAGITIPSSCEEGICGTCETRVLDGIPDHRDSILSPTERDSAQSMFVCVSRSHSRRLVLDC
jgi:ferredoxin-NADP reductase